MHKACRLNSSWPLSESASESKASCAISSSWLVITIFYWSGLLSPQFWFPSSNWGVLTRLCLGYWYLFSSMLIWLVNLVRSIWSSLSYSYPSRFSDVLTFDSSMIGNSSEELTISTLVSWLNEKLLLSFFSLKWFINYFWSNISLTFLIESFWSTMDDV